MSGKGKMVTPKQYSTMHEIPYTTVMYWLQNGKIDGAVKHETPFGHYWELPDDTPRPASMAGRPKKAAAKPTKKPAKRGGSRG